VAMTAGDIYTVAGNGLYRSSGATGPATAAQLYLPASVGVDPSGDTLIADTGNNMVMVTAAATGTLFGRAVTAGHIYDVAGDGTPGYSGNGGPGDRAELDVPEAVAADSAGNLLIADTGNEVIRVVAASTGTFYGVAMTAGHIYTVAGNGTMGYSGDGGPATSAELAYPYGIAADAYGNLIIPDTGNSRIRVVAASTGTFYGVAMTAGDIYTVAGDGTAGYSGDGGPATSAELNFPYGVDVDAAGNLVIADTANSRIRVVAASSGTFYGVAMTAGDIYTVAGDGTAGYSGDGGPATSAEINYPQGVSIDSAGNLLIADTSNQRIRVVAASTGTFYGVAMTAGDIYTVAGDGTAGFAGDGGPATSAELCYPGGVAADGTGLLIADTGYGNSATDRIREVTG
jgi:trimeric autotransporter adhesin